MKTIIILVVLAMAVSASADVYVRGYIKDNGTFVAPHIRSSPDQFKENNYGAQPYTYGR